MIDYNYINLYALKRKAETQKHSLLAKSRGRKEILT